MEYKTGSFICTFKFREETKTTKTMVANRLYGGFWVDSDFGYVHGEENPNARYWIAPSKIVLIEKLQPEDSKKGETEHQEQYKEKTVSEAISLSKSEDQEILDSAIKTDSLFTDDESKKEGVSNE